jgi:hypothetical protein
MHIYIYGYEQILEGSEYSPPSATRVNDIRTTYVWEKKDMILAMILGNIEAGIMNKGYGVMTIT